MDSHPAYRIILIPLVSPGESVPNLDSYQSLSEFAIYGQLTNPLIFPELTTYEKLLGLPSSRKQFRELSSIVAPARQDLCMMNDPTLLHLVEGIRLSAVRLIVVQIRLISDQRKSGLPRTVCQLALARTFGV